MSGQEESSNRELLIGADETLGFLKQDRFRSLDITALELTMMGDPTTFEALQGYQAVMSQSEGDFNEERFAELEAIRTHATATRSKRGQVNSSQDLASPHRTRPKRFHSSPVAIARGTCSDTPRSA